MNWGKGIALTFFIFCTGMIVIVGSTFREEVDLVTEEYYKEELVYQQKIDQSGFAHKAGNITLIQMEKAIRFTFPEGQLPTGKIYFYKPDKPALDRTFEITNRVTEIPKTELSFGKYRIKVTWESGGITFYQEDILFI